MPKRIPQSPELKQAKYDRQIADHYLKVAQNKLANAEADLARVAARLEVARAGLEQAVANRRQAIDRLYDLEHSPFANYSPGQR